jgi:hypothetical protein
MSVLARALFLAVMLALPASVRANPPRLTGTSPLGVERGKAMDVSIEGSGLNDGPRLIAPFDFRIEAPAGGRSDQSHWKLTLTVGTQVAA